MTRRKKMTYTISPSGIALIKKYEGFSPCIYVCPAGKPTIGYGHVVDASGPETITEAEAETLLLADLQPVIRTINCLVTVPLSQNQFDALCSLVYNIGTGAFSRSTLLRLLNSDTSKASSQFLRWIWGGGKILPGLRKRRLEERELFEKQ